MEAMLHQFPVRGLTKDESSRTFHDERSSSSPLTESLTDSRFDTVDVCTTQLYFPAQFESWNGFSDWSHDGSTLVNETWPYQDQPYSGMTDVWTPPLTDCRTDSSGSVDSKLLESTPFNSNPHANRTEQLSPSQVSTPQVRDHYMYHPQRNLQSQDKGRHHSVSQYHTDVQNQNRLLDSDWMGFSPRSIATSHLVSDTKPNLTFSKPTSPKISPEWPPYHQAIAETPFSSNDIDTLILKRKHLSPGPPAAKKSRHINSQAKLAEYVGVFENEPGALTTVKKRKKLDGAVRKAAQLIRKAGACHQCRFRKRTVCLDPLTPEACGKAKVDH